MSLDPAPLQGRFVRLEPYAEALKAIWRGRWTWTRRRGTCSPDRAPGPTSTRGGPTPPRPAPQGWGSASPCGRQSDQRIVGTTSYLNLRPADRIAEIGATFLHPDARAGAVNPEMKRLMLAHAFDGGLFGQPAHRVEIVTDALNLRSQAAIAKLGAVREGVLRRHKVTWTGRVRDTVMFSIIAEDWPAVRDRLDARLSAFAAA